jgi:hypothetical protein
MHALLQQHLDLLELDVLGVLHGVVQQAGRQALVVHLQLGQDARDLHGVRDEGLPALAPLPVVRVVGQVQRLQHLAAVLLAQVAQQRLQAAPQELVRDVLRLQRLVELHAGWGVSARQQEQIACRTGMSLTE